MRNMLCKGPARRVHHVGSVIFASWSARSTQTAECSDSRTGTREDGLLLAGACWRRSPVELSTQCTMICPEV